MHRRKVKASPQLLSEKFPNCLTLPAQLAAAVAFYTCFPIPSRWNLDFRYVARFAPLVGILIAALLAFLDFVLQSIGVPRLTASVIVVLVWIGITGGLHLDGAIDTADGLAVQDPQRRLQVMTDSATGAFGAMAAVGIVLLKTAALADLQTDRGLALLCAAGWGRWAQQLAIVCYPYLKPTGKGAFHKAALPSLRYLLPGLLLMLGLSGLPLGLAEQPLALCLGSMLGGVAIAWITGAWFHRRLGGHTGDTYGAVVEWTEALVLVLWGLLSVAKS